MSHARQSEGAHLGCRSRWPHPRQRTGSPWHSRAHRRQGGPANRQIQGARPVEPDARTVRRGRLRPGVPVGRPSGARRADIDRQADRCPDCVRPDRQPVRLRADDPPERDRAHPRGAAGRSRGDGRAYRRTEQLHRQGRFGGSGPHQARRRQRDASGRLARGLRWRAFGGSSRTWLRLRRLDPAIPLGAGRRPRHRPRSPGSPAHLLAPRRHTRLLSHRRGSLEGDRRPGSRRRRRTPSGSDARGNQRVDGASRLACHRDDRSCLARRLPHQRAQGEGILQGSRIPCGRRRPHSQPGRRPGHEHGHAGRLQSRLEAGTGDRRRGEARTPGQLLARALSRRRSRPEECGSADRAGDTAQSAAAGYPEHRPALRRRFPSDPAQGCGPTRRDGHRLSRQSPHGRERPGRQRSQSGRTLAAPAGRGTRRVPFHGARPS